MSNSIPNLTSSSLFSVSNKIVLVSSPWPCYTELQESRTEKCLPQVTGGSSGLGLAMATSFVENGAKGQLAL